MDFPAPPIPPETEAVAFFFAHAGYSHNPATETADEGRLRCARELAETEAWAKGKGLTVIWEDDWEVGNHRDFWGADSAYADREPDTCEMAHIEHRGEVVASLCCIDDATPEYRRVVEAELFSEARETVEIMDATRPLYMTGPSYAGASARYTLTVDSPKGPAVMDLLSSNDGKLRLTVTGDSGLAETLAEIDLGTFSAE